MESIRLFIILGTERDGDLVFPCVRWRKGRNMATAHRAIDARTDGAQRPHSPGLPPCLHIRDLNLRFSSI